MIERASVARERANSKNGLSLELINFKSFIEAGIEKAVDEGKYSCTFDIPDTLYLDKVCRTLCPELTMFGKLLFGRGYNVSYLSASCPRAIKIDWRQS